MKRLGCLLLSFLMLAGGGCVFGEEEAGSPGVSVPDGILLDDCVDFSVTSHHSEGLYTDVTAEENRYAFDDYTMFMRREANSEWAEYAIPEGQYLIFHTYFRQNEEISHFTFSWSADGESWSAAEPSVQVLSVEEWKWIPVIYTLKKLDDSAKYLRITFGNVGGTEWSPSIAGVYSKYKSGADAGFADCIGTPYYDVTALLKNLGLISGYNAYEYGPEDAITRAEFAKLTASVLNLNTAASGQEKQLFWDLKKDHWANGAVNVLYGIGVIQGDENGFFRPDDPVACQEAAKILVSALGYTVLAEEKGGYPAGFWQMALRLDLLKGVDAPAEQAVNRGKAAMMFANTLEAEAMHQTGFGGDENQFQRDGSTVLNQYHQIYEVNGVLSDVGAMSIVSDSIQGAGTAVISEQIFQAGAFPLEEMLGQKVKAYVNYADQSGRGKILYAAPVAGSQSVEISSDAYEGLDSGRIVYEDAGGREVKRAFTNNTRVVYNGRYDTRMGVTDKLDFSCGFMKLIQYPGSAGVDVILIEDYQTYQMASAGRLGGSLTDRSKGAVNLGLDSAEAVRVFCCGEETSYTPELMVQENDLVQAAVSRDGRVAAVQILRDRVSGVLTSLNADADICTVGTQELRCAAVLETAKLSGMLGREVTAYLDVTGAAAVLEAGGLMTQYGYLQAVSGADSLSGAVQLRIVTKSGTAEVYTADAKTRVNGSRGSVPVLAGLMPQLVRFSAGEDKTIVRLETAGEAGGQIGLDNFSKNFQSDSCKYYGDQMKLFSSVYQLDSDTKVFLIPRDRNEIRDYQVRDYNSLMTDKSYAVTLYDVDANYVVGAAVIDLSGSDARRLENYDPVAVVESTANLLDAEGNRCLAVFAKVNGQDAQIYFDADGGEDLTGAWIPNYQIRSTAEGNDPFQPGEVFQYYMDDESHCKYFRMLLTGSVLEQDGWYESHLGDYGALNEQSYFSELYSMYGVVTDKFAGKVIARAGDSGFSRTFSLDGAAVYRCQPKGQRLLPGDAADLVPGSRVFVRMNFTAVKEILVIE